MDGNGMDRNRYLGLVRDYVANWAIGPTTLRGQGRGVTGAARAFVATIDLGEVAHLAIDDYPAWLNDRTTELMANFREGAQNNWGAARKAINLFMVGAYWNKVLSEAYGLGRLRDSLETPLDKQAAKNLRDNGQNLPKFPGIKRLTAVVSQQYQDYASQYAVQVGLPRAELDIVLWQAGG